MNELTPIQREAVIARCRVDIDFLVKTIGYHKPGKHNLDWMDLIRAAQARHENQMIIACVGSAKSTTKDILATQDLLGGDPFLKDDPHLIFASKADDVVKDTTLELRGIQKKLYGEKTHVWEKHKFKAPRTKPSKYPSCYGATTNTSIEGMRGNRGYPDDPADRQSAKSPAYRRDSIDWWTGTYLARMDPGANVYPIGSPWHIDDLYMFIIRRGMKTDMYPAERHPCPKIYSIYPNVTWHGDEYDLLWPERLTREFLDEKRKDMGPTAYAQRFLCDPTALLGVLFKPEWFEDKYISMADVPEDCYCEWGIDLADSTDENADETAITVGLFPKDSKDIYIADCIHGRWDALQFERDELPGLYNKWRPERITIEKTGQKGRIKYLKNNTGLPFVEQEAIGSKVDRFRTLEAPVEGGRFKFVDCTGVRDLIHQAILYDPEVDGMDDQVDSWEILSRRHLHGGVRPEYTASFGERKDW